MMSPLGAASVGAMTVIVGLVLSALYCWQRMRSDRGAVLSALAAFLRTLALASGYKSVVVLVEGNPAVIPFEDIARAIEKADVSMHIPVRLERGVPPGRSYDGRA